MISSAKTLMPSSQLGAFTQLEKALLAAKQANIPIARFQTCLYLIRDALLAYLDLILVRNSIISSELTHLCIEILDITMINKAEDKLKDLLLNMVRVAAAHRFVGELCYGFQVAIRALSTEDSRSSRSSESSATIQPYLNDLASLEIKAKINMLKLLNLASKNKKSRQESIVSMLISSGRLSTVSVGNPTEQAILSRGEATCQSYANSPVILDKIRTACTATDTKQDDKIANKETELQSFDSQENKLTEAFIDQIHLRIDSSELINQLVAKIPELMLLLQPHLIQLTVAESGTTRSWCRNMVELLVPEEEYEGVGLKEKIFQFAESMVSLTNRRLAVMILEEEEQVVRKNDSHTLVDSSSVDDQQGSTVSSCGSATKPLIVNIVQMPQQQQQSNEVEDGEVDEEEVHEPSTASSILAAQSENYQLSSVSHQAPLETQQRQQASSITASLSSNQGGAPSSAVSSVIPKRSTPGVFSRALRQYSTAPPSYVPSFTTPSSLSMAASSLSSSSSSAYHLLPVPPEMIIVGASCRHDSSKVLLNILKQRNPPVIGESLVKMVHEFAKNGGNVNDFYPEDKRTALSFCASHSENNVPIEVMQALLDNGANIDQADCKSRTPLMWAICVLQRNKAQFLLEYGACILRRAKGGSNALDMAQKTMPDFLALVEKSNAKKKKKKYEKTIKEVVTGKRSADEEEEQSKKRTKIESES